MCPLGFNITHNGAVYATLFKLNNPLDSGGKGPLIMQDSNTHMNGWFARVGALRHRALIHLLLWQLGCAKAETQTTEAERNCLARHACGKRMLAEIGVYHGVTTRRLRSAMDENGILSAVDPFRKGRLGFSAPRIIALREVSKVKTGDVRWMRTTGIQAAKELLAGDARQFDFVFIDGDHSWDGLKADWEGWKELLVPGGIIALHDSRLTPLRQLEGTGSVQFTRDVIMKIRNLKLPRQSIHLRSCEKEPTGSICGST